MKNAFILAVQTAILATLQRNNDALISAGSKIVTEAALMPPNEIKKLIKKYGSINLAALSLIPIEWIKEEFSI